MNDHGSREAELRRLAERQGLTLRKSPDQESGAEGGYQLVAAGGQTTITGDGLHEYALNLDEVEALLTNDQATPQAQVVSSPRHTRKAARGAETRTTE
ncbi:MAG TPA: hypothetical protein VKZ96_06110 [Thermomicrobiales bacterium]|nr:hypothetical protein [Thermomicrobiales bacterium]